MSQKYPMFFLARTRLKYKKKAPSKESAYKPKQESQPLLK